MKNLLIVEDNRIAGTLIRTKVLASLDWQIFWARSRKEATELLDKHENNFFAALLDFRLPDADQGEIIDEVTSRNISSIVFTAATVTKQVRAQLWKKRIVDYVIKDDAQSLNYIATLLSRLEKNLETSVLVVDDSASSRTLITKLLKIHNYRVLEARNGAEALETLDANPDINLVITDYTMPEMDGFTLVKRLRTKYGKEGISILGVTADQNATMGANFIKCGADDFIDKSNFIIEEFYCRVSQCLEKLERIREIRELATTDFLTGLYNRRHFYETAQKIYGSAKRSKHRLACAMLDIDHFKRVNDTHGHRIGDQVIKHVASILTSHLQRTSDLVGRVGGEEFCILADDIAPQHAYRMFENIRIAIEQQPLTIKGNKKLSVTVSIGICTNKARSLDSMLNKADKLLYEAKNEGRNLATTDHKSPRPKKTAAAE